MVSKNLIYKKDKNVKEAAPTRVRDQVVVGSIELTVHV